MKDKSVSNDKFTLRQFNYRFPDDDACLEEIKIMKYGEMIQCPKCSRDNPFYRIKGRKAYACSFCGYQVNPLAGTIFAKSSTPLRDWFYAMYLMTQTRSGMSAKQLERMLGVTYKTAWRMFHQIRKLMADDGDMFTGKPVEIDEAYVGGKGANRAKVRKDIEYNKQVVVGIVQRGGKVKAKHVKSSGARALLPEIEKFVSKDTQIYTDEYGSYKSLTKLGYKHEFVRHKTMEFKKGNAHTNTIENFWSNFKRGMHGVYRGAVKPQHLQAYIDEYSFRYSNRDNPNMFNSMLKRVS